MTGSGSQAATTSYKAFSPPSRVLDIGHQKPRWQREPVAQKLHLDHPSRAVIQELDVNPKHSMGLTHIFTLPWGG